MNMLTRKNLNQPHGWASLSGPCALRGLNLISLRSPIVKWFVKKLAVVLAMTSPCCSYKLWKKVVKSN